MEIVAYTCVNTPLGGSGGNCGPSSPSKFHSKGDIMIKEIKNMNQVQGLLQPNGRVFEPNAKIENMRQVWNNTKVKCKL